MGPPSRPVPGRRLLALCLLIAGLSDLRIVQSQGILGIRPFIIGGADVEKNEFPYMVTLQRGRDLDHYCGAVLIGPNIVLTAAHCVSATIGIGTPPKFPPLRVGGILRRNGQALINETAEVFKSCKLQVHPSYSGNLAQGFDIAIIMINGSSTVFFPPVKNNTELEVGTLLTAVGFGVFDNTSRPASTLQKTDMLGYITNEECSKLYESLNLPILDSMMCAFDPGSDACQGDSGGPLLLSGGFGMGRNREDERTDVVVGVTSFGARGGCEDETLPAVYTRVSSFFGWIQETIEAMNSEDFTGDTNPECDEAPPPPEEEPSPPPEDKVTADAIIQALVDNDIPLATELIVKAVGEAKAMGMAMSEVVLEAMERAQAMGLRQRAGTALLRAINSPEVGSEDVTSAINALQG